MESFNSKLRDELLNRELFYTLLEAQVLTKQYRQTYNRIRLHSSLGYRPPAPETILPSDLNQYQSGMCISGRLTMTARTPRHLISPLGPNWVGTGSAVWRYVHFTLALV